MWFQVRTLQRNCNKKASCNCAVVVKSGDDVIKIDRCGAKKGGKKQPLVPKLYINDELTPGTRIISFNNGKKWKVYIHMGCVFETDLSLFIEWVSEW